MHNFFKESPNSKTSTKEENEYDFEPIKNDQSDEHTQDLFEQLEDGANQYTDIYETVKLGANLYARKSYSKYTNCLPIHIAAYNVGCNTEAINSILETFDDPEERKKYLYLKDSSGRNALEILIEEPELDESIVIPSIKSILSYLTADEQRQIMRSLSKKALDRLDDYESAVTREQDINDLAELNYFFKQEKTIDMCKQRRKEESKALADYESDEESLGKLDSVDHKKFTARVSYKDTIENGFVINSIPELILIPSDWRLETAMQDNNQGDHVTAYVLLLSSLSHCKGENIKLLPDLVCKLAIDVLPDHKELFLQKKQKSFEVLNSYRTVRVETISALKAECDKNGNFVSMVENSLKKVEIESIARHIEDSIDHFIMIINKLEDETFSQKRKQSITGKYILQQLRTIIGKVELLNDKKHHKFRDIILNAILNEENNTNSGVTEKTLKRIVDMIFKNDFSNINIPQQFLSKSFKLTKGTIIDFIKLHTPLKKYHEGYVIKDIKVIIMELVKTNDQFKRNELLNKIGFLCFNLFDYPRVNDETMNNEYVLYQAIPRHFIIINSAFSYLKEISINEKKVIYDSFINNILMLQLWNGHLVLDNNQEIKPLDLNLLKERILKFATLDSEHNFSMKPKSEHPQYLHASDIDNNKGSTKNVVLDLPKRR